MFQFKIILLIVCLEVYSGSAYQCPKSIPYSAVKGLSRVSLPVSNALLHFKIENEFLIDSNGRTRYVCVEFKPEMYALRDKTVNYENDLRQYVQTGEDFEGHIIAHSIGGSSDSLNVFPLNHNCKSELNSNFERELEGLLAKHSRITYIAELEYTLHNKTDVRPTRINTVYMDENENVLGSVGMLNSPPNTPCETVDLENTITGRGKRSLAENSTLPDSAQSEGSTKPSINCLDGCRRSACWQRVEERDKNCRSHFHSVHSNQVCTGEWCYCCSYY